ncbi:EamA family transporter [Thermovorax subterraneus]|nr:EamA family transporter [Thermovorax subterraneus]
MKAEKIKGYLAGIGFSTIFGFSFLFTKNALDKVDPIKFIGFRFAVAALAVALIAALGIVRVSFKGKSLKPLFLFRFWSRYAIFYLKPLE